MKKDVKVYRVLSGLTQEELAKELDIAHSTYLQKEKKRTCFSTKEYLVLQKKFDLTDEELVELMKNMEG